MIQTQPVEVIGQFIPTAKAYTDQFEMAVEFSSFLVDKGYLFNIEPHLAIECRPPTHAWSLYTDEVFKAKYGEYPDGALQVHRWHNDAVSLPWVSAMWSNMFPTEFVLLDQEKIDIFVPEPFDVVIVRDFECKHRCPQITVEQAAYRYFVRAAVKLPVDTTFVF